MKAQGAGERGRREAQPDEDAGSWTAEVGSGGWGLAESAEEGGTKAADWAAAEAQGGQR